MTCKHAAPGPSQGRPGHRLATCLRPSPSLPWQSRDLAWILQPYQIALHYTPRRVFRGDSSGAFVFTFASSHLPSANAFVLLSSRLCIMVFPLHLRLGLQMRRLLLLLLLRFPQLFAQFSFHFGSFFNCSPQMLSIFIFLLLLGPPPPAAFVLSPPTRRQNVFATIFSLRFHIIYQA